MNHFLNYRTIEVHVNKSDPIIIILLLQFTDK